MNKRVTYYIWEFIIFPISIGLVGLVVLVGIFLSGFFLYLAIPLFIGINAVLNSIKCPRCGYPLHKKKGAWGLFSSKIFVDDECENCNFLFYNEGKE